MASSSSAPKDDKAPAAGENKPETVAEQKPTAALEEDDEFEDFPVDGALRLASPYSIPH